MKARDHDKPLTALLVIDPYIPYYASVIVSTEEIVASVSSI